MSEIHFGVWAPDEETFWQSWITAGIGNFYDDNGNVVAWPNGTWQYSPSYPGIQTTTSWSGKIVDVPATYDENGNELTPATMIDGWHTNVRVTGPLVDTFTVGLEQRELNGNLKSIWARSRAATVFSLNARARNPTTRFPAGYRNPVTRVVYADKHPENSAFSSPENVWA